MKKIFLIFPLILLLFASTVNAQTLWGTSVSFEDLIDKRTFSSSHYNPPSSQGGLSGYWPYSFSIAWNISYNLGTELWTYEYMLTATKKDVSHFILEVSNSIGEGAFYDVKIDGKPAFIADHKVWGSSKGKSNPGLPNNFYGIKFENGVSYSFTTELDPVWGNFYAKSGKDEGKWVYAYNKALGVEQCMNENAFNDACMQKINFIPRPDGGSNPPVVPEPISFVLFIIGSAVLGARLYWKKK